MLEISQGERGFDRVSVRVTVALLRPGPDGEAVEAARGEQRIVRRYRAAPSPLVRDHRGLRSGRLDRVLAGDFDVMR